MAEKSMKYIDLRSDTVTWPTDEMRAAMAEAPVGDDVWGDDPTVIELERYAASIVGKEASLFVPSGTFGNQLAIYTHCSRGQEIVLDDDSHIVQHEAGAAAAIAGVQLRVVTGIEKDGKKNVIEASAFESKIRTQKNMHEPKTGLICIENARACGRALPITFMEEIKYISTRHHLPIHLDGARIFNAATALGVQAVDITKHVDTVMFCLSKGLCAPVGSILAGSAEFIEKARWNRKMLGGAMRQVGILAASGMIGLKKMRLRLDLDHQNAEYFASELEKIEQIEINVSDTEINMVFFKFTGNTIDSAAFTEYMENKGILVGEASPDGSMRLVTHYWITRTNIDTVIATIKQFLN